MRRSLQSLDEHTPGALAHELSKLDRANDHDLFTAVDRDMLRPLVLRPPDDLAESGLGVLQLPPPGA